MIFSAKDRQRLSTLLSHNEQPVWRANVAVRECFEQIASQLERRVPATAETGLKICLNALLAEVLHLLESKNIPLQESLSSTRRTVELFLSSLPEHLDHPWDLGSMASQCGLGRSRFEHYCQEITNLTPNRFLAHCRLQAAAKMLRDSPDRTITEVAFDCGFESSQYFANVFRREFSCSPSDYRQQHGGGGIKKI
jgi:AraC family L-rhamnose operon regulatory protein RhaS